MVTPALSMLRNSDKKKKKGQTGSKYDFSIRRRDLKRIKNALGRVTCSVNWRQDNSCKSCYIKFKAIQDIDNKVL